MRAHGHVSIDSSGCRLTRNLPTAESTKVTFRLSEKFDGQLLFARARGARSRPRCLASLRNAEPRRRNVRNARGSGETGENGAVGAPAHREMVKAR